MYTYSRGVHPVKRLLHKFISIICASAYNYMIAITPEKIGHLTIHVCNLNSDRITIWYRIIIPESIYGCTLTIIKLSLNLAKFGDVYPRLKLIRSPCGTCVCAVSVYTCVLNLVWSHGHGITYLLCLLNLVLHFVCIIQLRLYVAVLLGYLFFLELLNLVGTKFSTKFSTASCSCIVVQV